MNDDELRFPKTRGECKNGLRPCPFLRCKYHLWTDLVEVRGKSRLRMRRSIGNESCCLDVADRGYNTLQQIADALGLTREGVRQTLESALASVRDGVTICDRLEEEFDDRVPCDLVDEEEGVPDNDDHWFSYDTDYY